ncbi:MAG: DNA-binding protein Alba [Candidatus Bathyarchaeota archaeon]|nr:MAG: DNA-binding protein Alba [Candidatus Bathyarchaeota archaeon]
MFEKVVKEQNIVYIGRKPVMTYVMAIINGFTGLDTSKVTLRARGRAIPTAVDAAEVTRRQFMHELQVSNITIGTEEIPQELGRTRAVSTIDITLTRTPSENHDEAKHNEQAEVTTPTRSITLMSIAGIGVKRAEQLRSCSVASIMDLANCDAHDLSEKLSVSEKQVLKWIEDARMLSSNEVTNVD